MFVVIHILDYYLNYVNAFLEIILKIHGGGNLLYKNIISLCKRTGLSVSALERSTGLGNGTIRGWEKSSPTVDKLKAVADHFGVSIDALLSVDLSAKEVK